MQAMLIFHTIPNNSSFFVIYIHNLIKACMFLFRFIQQLFCSFVNPALKGDSASSNHHEDEQSVCVCVWECVCVQYVGGVMVMT